MNSNITEKFQGGGKSTKAVKNVLNNISKTAKSALDNLQDYGREKNLPRWITDAFDTNRDLAPYSGKGTSGVLPEINTTRFSYNPENINGYNYKSHYEFSKENPVQYYVEKPTHSLRQYTEYNQALKNNAMNMGLNPYNNDINLRPFTLISDNNKGFVTHKVEVPVYTNPVKNYLHPTNGARRVEATYMPSEGYVYKTEVNSPRDTYFEAKRVNEHELPSVKEQLKKKGFFNVSADNSPIYSNFDSADNSINVKFTKVPSSVEDIRHINTYIIPGKPFRNNQFLTKTVPATAGAGAAGALGAYVYNLMKDKSEEK